MDDGTRHGTAECDSVYTEFLWFVEKERGLLCTRWALTSYKWTYNPYKWSYKWVIGVILPISGDVTVLITGRGPPCMPFSSRDYVSKENMHFSIEGFIHLFTTGFTNLGMNINHENGWFFDVWKAFFLTKGIKWNLL